MCSNFFFQFILPGPLLLLSFYSLGTLLDPELLAEFAKLGVYCQFDLFGIECSYYQFNTEIDMPSDAVRLDNIVKLVNEGYLNRILMSHDIHTKHRLVNQAPLNSEYFEININFFLQTDGVRWSWIRSHSQQCLT